MQPGLPKMVWIYLKNNEYPMIFLIYPFRFKAFWRVRNYGAAGLFFMQAMSNIWKNLYIQEGLSMKLCIFF